MPTVFWYRIKNPITGEMDEASRKATEATIESLSGEKVLGSAEEVHDDQLEPGGFFTSPYPPDEVREREAWEEAQRSSH